MSQQCRISLSMMGTMQLLDGKLLLKSGQHAHPWLDGTLCAADVMLKQLRMCWLADHLHTVTMVQDVLSLRNSRTDIVSAPLHCMCEGTAIDQARRTSSWRPQQCTLTTDSCMPCWVIGAVLRAGAYSECGLESQCVQMEAH